jgi:hypothetical protein
MTHDENMAHYSLWIIAKAPILLGFDIIHMSEDLKSIVSNPEVIGINQDPMGIQAQLVSATHSKSIRSIVQIEPCANNHTFQKWIISKDGTIRSQDGRCLTVQNCDTYDVATVNLSPCGEPKCHTTNQKWKFPQYPNNITTIHTDLNDKCMEVYYSYGPNVEISTCLSKPSIPQQVKNISKYLT